MRVLVFAHRLELGGTQTNAVELAERVARDHGHDVVLFATPGPASALTSDRAVRLIEAPSVDQHPSLTMMRALSGAVRREQPDLIHVWDWPQCLDAYFGAHLQQRVPLVCSAMGMTVPRVLPRTVPTTFGTPALHAEARRLRPESAFLLEPPVDLDRNRPGVVDGTAFRSRHGVATDELLVVVVSRLTRWMKQEGLERLIVASGRLARSLPHRLVIVGEGPVAPRLGEMADAVNERLGRPVVTLAGPLVDPRPAYEAADIVAGMGSSGLRALAFGKPLLVLGERGFSEIFQPSTASWFVWHGIYGLGDGDPSSRLLTGQLGELLRSADRRRELSSFSYDLVTGRYGLGAAAHQLELVYQVAVGRSPSTSAMVRDGLRTAGVHWGGRAIRQMRSVA